MALLLNLIFLLAFAGAVGGGFHLWRTHLDNARRDGMQALAARRGWALTVTDDRLGRAGTLRLVPRGGHPWIAEVRRPDSQPGGPVTEYEAGEPRWAEGTLILVPSPLDGSVAHPAEVPPSQPAPLDGKALRNLLGEEVARLAVHLQQVPAPAGVTALSNGDPFRRTDLDDLALALGGFAPVAAGAKRRPILILSPEGTRLRLRYAVKRPDQMERFLDLAFALSRRIGP